MNSVTHLRGALTRLSAAGETQAYLEQETPPALTELDADFATLALAHQEHHPAASGGGPWTTWLMLGGRGAGKTRLGAEWVRALVHGTPPYADHRYASIALVGESEHDVREVMVEGISGILRTSPRAQRPEWISSRRRLEWPNGAVAHAFSAEDPDSLRGPQFDAAWCDELAKWRYVEETFDMLQFGLRLGLAPRQLITTTPRPLPLIKRLLADASTRVTRAPTHANREFLSPAFFDTVAARYAGTRIGRQEIDGEIIEDREGALWTRVMLEACRVAAAPELERIVVGIDPPASARPGAAACGIVAAGKTEDGFCYVLEDATEAGLSPLGWARKAVALYRRLKADALVVEVNMGGDMVYDTLRQVDVMVPIREVHARRGKYIRAEPVAALYEQGKVKHVGGFPQLEDEMCDFNSDGLSSGRSPDRLDALVWALTALAIRQPPQPRIRRL
jgi:phage terminase large subunit-like protein